MTKCRRQLAALLRDARDELIVRWTQRVLEEPQVPSANRLSEPELRNEVPKLLDAIIQDLAGEGRPHVGPATRRHARDRASQGFSIGEEMRELSLLRAVIFDLCAERRLRPPCEAFRTLDAAIDERMSIAADEMERARRESEVRLRAVFDTTMDGIITIDEHGTIETFNPAAERLFGYQAQEIVGRNVRLLMPEPYRSEMDESRLAGVREMPGRHKSGAVFPIGLSINDTWVDGRHIFTGIIRDITDRKRAESEREQVLASERAARAEAERAARLRDEFVATVSHELRTPLNAILGWTTMLRGGKLDAAATAKALEVVERNARAQAELVEDLLDISRIGSGKLRLEVRRREPRGRRRERHRLPPAQPPRPRASGSTS